MCRILLFRYPAGYCYINEISQTRLKKCLLNFQFSYIFLSISADLIHEFLASHDESLNTLCSIFFKRKMNDFQLKSLNFNSKLKLK